MQKRNNLLALDIGEVRVGVAIVADGVAVPRLLPTLTNDDLLLGILKKIAQEKEIDRIVVGLPRNLNGEETRQTAYVRSLSEQIKSTLGLPVDFQDEALTSVQAEQTLKMNGEKYDKADIDSLAASRILVDYLDEAGI